MNLFLCDVMAMEERAKKRRTRRMCVRTKESEAKK